ncbi:orf135 [Artaxa digramma nucleopolyhedrovirus]|uniref:Orf135 n=1 Tax=Artaxa digramma nucleopolyhedrovirus TaxID=3070910 RepID=A0AAE6R721_9ABAC|nr:orf135 [Euproctis digramma nucleopolyhedrovirus]QHB21794.1 orf135 [Artaxa digramma nucleopolyhedrovirus]
MAITVILLLFVLPLLIGSQLLLNATAPTATPAATIAPDGTDIEVLFKLIMEQVSKIQNNEITDYGYTRMIFVILIIFFIFSIKSKIYRLLSCVKKKKKSLAGECALENITIRELNYNVNQH